MISTYNVALPSLVYYLQRRVNVHYAAEPFIADAPKDTTDVRDPSEADYAVLRRPDPDTDVHSHAGAGVRGEAETGSDRGAKAPELVLITNQCVNAMNASFPVRYLTLAYGENERVYDQASMLLLSLIAYAPAPRELVVVTDHPERFAWFEGRSKFTR